MNTIKMYEILKTELGDEDAHAFIDKVISTVNEKLDETLKVLATKEDLANL